jgi:glutamate dehydrogenase (NAD(P)+)
MREFFRHPEDVKAAGLEGGLIGKRIIIQGLGNVGYHAARLLDEEDGCKIIVLIERDGALINENGIRPERVRQFMTEHKTIKGYPDALFTDDAQSALQQECDILIPAAMESQITVANADRIRTRLIIEAANGPVTYEADEILRKRGITIIPDAYVNAGGVTVSYFEWIRNMSHIRFGRMERRYDEIRGEKILNAIETMAEKTSPEWIRKELVRGADELDLVRSGLDDTMRLSYQEIKETLHSNDKVHDLRTAAYVIAVSKIARSYIDIGVY